MTHRSKHRAAAVTAEGSCHKLVEFLLQHCVGNGNTKTHTHKQSHSSTVLTMRPVEKVSL